ncbi:MAG TPA: hypothetical protein VEP49_19470 [Acidimicrobiia bacterium]|nr:hypothetical protein [Acidimicrobiia bacterium]
MSRDQRHLRRRSLTVGGELLHYVCQQLDEHVRSHVTVEGGIRDSQLDPVSGSTRGDRDHIHHLGCGVVFVPAFDPPHGGERRRRVARTRT